MKHFKIRVVIAVCGLFAVLVIVSGKLFLGSSLSTPSAKSERTVPETNSAVGKAISPEKLAASNAVRDLVKLPPGPDTFRRVLTLALSRDEDSTLRLLSIQKLSSLRGTLSNEQLTELKGHLLRLAKQTDEPAAVVATAIRSLVGLLQFMESKGLTTKAELAGECNFLGQIASDSRLALEVRGAAIRAAGEVQFENARQVVEAVLSEPATVNTPELARNGCLALAKLAGNEAVPPIRQVLQNTTNAAIFGTAAFSIGQLTSADAMVALVVNSERFPDSGSCGAALVNMDSVVLAALEQPANPSALHAIRATEHLWKEGQRERYIPKLRSLLTDGPNEIRQAACERLIDAAGRLPFAEEKIELSMIHESIQQTPSLADQAERIRRRMSATVLAPTSETKSVPTKRKD